MDEHLPRGPLTAAEFFGLDLEGVTLTAAHTGTGLAYTTVLRIRDRGPDCDPGSVRKIAAWSRALPAAQAAGAALEGDEGDAGALSQLLLRVVAQQTEAAAIDFTGR